MFHTYAGLSLTLLLGCTAASAANADGGALHIFAWSDYVAPDLISKFEKETGIKVTIDNYDSNDALLAKLQASPGATGYDIAIPSNNYVNILADQNLIAKIDVAAMPNYKNVDERWRKPAWDPTQSYTVPWEWGTTSVAYLADKVPGGIRSWKDLFVPADDLKGKIQVLRSGDGMPELAELYLGLPFCTENASDLEKVQAVWLGLKPYVKIFDDAGMGDRMASGDTSAAIMYTGLAYQARTQNLPNMRYAFPKEGAEAWFDNLVVPTGAPNMDNALKFMNFVMDPQNMAIETNYSGDSNPISATKPYLDPKVANAPESTAPADVPLHFMQKCSPKVAKLNSMLWASILK